MYKKKHMILAVVCTAIVTVLLCRLYLINFSGYESGDTVIRARKIIKDYYVNELTDENLVDLKDGAIAGMVAGLKDPYSCYLNKQDLENYQEDKEESYQGIGVTIIFDTNKKVMKINSVDQDTPAHKAGLLVGDELLKAGDIEIKDAKSYQAVLDYIRKGKEDVIPLTVRRDGSVFEVSVKRELINRKTISYKMYGNSIGYIYISEFIQNTAPDFAKALDALKSEGMRGLIIDLRDNPGGYAEVVLEITDMLLPKGVIAYLEDNKGKRQYFHSDDTCLDVPMTVLIDGGTASAAELLAGSLKAHELATIIGEKSYGKAVAQALFPVTADTAIYLTHARYFTPNGECIDKVGIEPDIKVSLAPELVDKIPQLEPEEDAQLSKGMEILMEKLGA